MPKSFMYCMYTLSLSLIMWMMVLRRVSNLILNFNEVRCWKKRKETTLWNQFSLWLLQLLRWEKHLKINLDNQHLFRSKNNIWNLLYSNNNYFRSQKNPKKKNQHFKFVLLRQHLLTRKSSSLKLVSCWMWGEFVAYFCGGTCCKLSKAFPWMLINFRGLRFRAFTYPLAFFRVASTGPMFGCGVRALVLQIY
jgi:hypothetical protein